MERIETKSRDKAKKDLEEKQQAKVEEKKNRKKNKE
jgi:hypothetical protein